jgi:hypothetical protein
MFAREGVQCDFAISLAAVTVKARELLKARLR